MKTERRMLAKQLWQKRVSRKFRKRPRNPLPPPDTYAAACRARAAELAAIDAQAQMIAQEGSR